MGQIAELKDRGIIRLTGDGVREFLQGLVTCDMASVSPSQPAFGALLTPQGKILFDFLVFETGDEFLLDCRRDAASDLAKRLTFYRLRAPIEIEDLTEVFSVFAGWGDMDIPEGSAPDPRMIELGWRRAGEKGSIATSTELDNYHVHRVALGVPEGGLDFTFGEAFPHEANMDLLNGISFSKGCYVGQEVVSRMQHRGTARTRAVVVSFCGDAPSPGSKIMADGKSIGAMGSAANGHAIALVRIDKVRAAQNNGMTFDADGSTIEIPPVADAPESAIRSA